MKQLSPKFMVIIKDIYKWLSPEDKKTLIEELTKTMNDAAVQTNVQSFAETGVLFMQSLLAGPLAIGAAAVGMGGSRRYRKKRRSKRTRSKK
jgi:pantothenate kinase-related protein Tda10